MPSRDVLRVLEVIARNIRLARYFIEDLSFEAFAAGVRAIYAVTRRLEIISEASRQLPEELKSRHPGVPWRQIAGAGNIYRHDYEDVLPEILWNSVNEELAGLEKAVRAEIA